MRKFVIMAVASAQVLLLSGCAAMWKNVAYSDDLYSVHNKIAIAERQKAEAELAKAQYEAQRAQYEAQRAQYEATLAQANAQAAQQGIIVGDESTFNGYDAVLADSYESAYARRLYGFSSPTYNMPSSYYTWRYSDAFHYASAYDPAFYNIVVSGDMVWAEPKYITSMFGTWGATVIPSYGWYYGWNDPYYYWSSSYRWNWYNSWYSPYYWSWGCNSPYSYYHYHHHHYKPHYPHHNHRPSYHRPPQNNRPPQHDNRPPQAGSGSVGNTGHHQINRPGTVVDRNPGTTRPADRVTIGSPRPSMPSTPSTPSTPSKPSTPSTSRVSQPVNRVGGTAAGYTSGSSSYRNGSSNSSSSSNKSNGSTSKSGTTSKGSVTQKSPAYREGSSSNATKSSPTYRNSTSSSSSSSYRSSGSSSSSSSSYRSSSSSSSHSFSSGSSGGYRPSSSGGGNSRGR